MATLGVILMNNQDDVLKYTTFISTDVMDKKEIAERAYQFAGRRENVERDSVAVAQIKDFLARYPFKEKPELLRNVSPDDLYDRTSNDRFFDWLTMKTDRVGVSFTCERAIFPEAVRRFDFLKVLLTVLVSEKRSVSFKIDQNWGVIPGFGGERMIAKKLLSIYYWERVVPVFRTEHMELFSSGLGIAFKNSALQKYRKDYSLLSMGQKFELLNAGLVEFKIANMEKMTNTQFASFLYSLFLPSVLEGEKADDGAESETAKPDMDSGSGSAASEYEARIREADRMISDLRRQLVIREERIAELEQELKMKSAELAEKDSLLGQREEKVRQELSNQLKEAERQSEIEKAELKRKISELTGHVEELERVIGSRESGPALQLSGTDRDRSDVVNGEMDTFHQQGAEDGRQRLKTGIDRLDDLLNGGIPAGSQFIVYGPSFIGKELVINAFAAEGLAEGAPLIWITTDRTIDEIRAEMTSVISSYTEYEKNGLVYYIDAYSRIVGDDSVSENAAYLDENSSVETINDMANSRISSIETLVKEKGYRLVFRSVSSLSANHDIKSIFALLRQFVAHRRKDRCVGIYSVEKGIMPEQDLQIINSIMDGVIEFSTDTRNNFLAVRGICETQSRDRIQYTLEKSTINIGSFFLGRIK